MALRVVKHLGARSCAGDAAVPLMLVPTFPGEKVIRAHISGYFASGDDSAIDQPGELNWYGISVPWPIFWATEMLNAGASPEDFGDVTDFDQLYNMWLKQATDESYGGDVDIDPETTTGEEGHALTEELIDSGPIGVSKWYSREVVMHPLAAEGNTVIRFGDSFNAFLKNIPTAAFGTLLMFGIVRFATTAESNFNIELDDATSREGMGLLLTGDYTKVGAMVEGNTAALGDYLRTVLYGGDNYIEADTIKEPAGKAIVKGAFTIETKMGREHK